MVTQLSPREQEVIQLVADGLVTKAIAANLSIGENTVKGHLKSICLKLGVSGRTAAATTWLRSKEGSDGAPSKEGD